MAISSALSNAPVLGRDADMMHGCCLIAVTDGDAEFECAEVLTGHTQDVKHVQWHPTDDVRSRVSRINEREEARLNLSAIAITDSMTNATCVNGFVFDCVWCGAIAVAVLVQLRRFDQDVGRGRRRVVVCRDALGPHVVRVGDGLQRQRHSLRYAPIDSA